MTNEAASFTTIQVMLVDSSVTTHVPEDLNMKEKMVILKITKELHFNYVGGLGRGVVGFTVVGWLVVVDIVVVPV